jgi:Tfp pilus assembly protein PilX
MLKPEKLKTLSSVKIKEDGSNSKRIKLRSRQKGSILLGIIITMVIMASLGAGMYYLTTTSTFQELFANNHARAYYAAESGGRYATARIREAYLQPTQAARDTILATIPGTYNNGTAANFVISPSTLTPTGNPETVTFTSTGTVNSGFLQAKRQINYSITPANPYGSGGGSDNIPIEIGQLGSPGANWGGVVPGTVDGAAAIMVNPTTSNRDGGEDRVNVGYTGSLGAYWTAAGGLSYDAQVKVKSDADYFLAGLAFRMNGGTQATAAGYCAQNGCIQSLCTVPGTDGNPAWDNNNHHCNSGHCAGTSYLTTETECLNWHDASTTGTSLSSFYVSFMRSSDNGDYEARWDGNADSIPSELTNFVTTNDYYIVLWMEDPISNTIQAERIIAYKKLPANSGVFTALPPVFEDNMTSQGTKWTPSSSTTWVWRSDGYWRGTVRQNREPYAVSLETANSFSLTSPAQLTFRHQMSSFSDHENAYVEIYNGSAWTPLTDAQWNTTTIDNVPDGWSTVSFTIPSTTTKIRFWLSTTSSTDNHDRRWSIDDVKIVSPPVSFTPWSTLLVRIQEKTLTSSDTPAGNMPATTRVNDIMVYYGTPTNNPRDTDGTFDTANWPLPAGSSGVVNTSAAAVSDPNFTLVQWDWVRSAAANGVITTPPIAPAGLTGTTWWYDTWNGTNDTTGTVARFQTLRNNTIVRTTYNLTPSTIDSIFGTTRQEVGLNAFGNAIENSLWFDDFAVKTSSGSSGNLDGNGEVVQY